MSDDDIDAIADALGAVKAGASRSRLPVVSVADDGQTVTLVLQTPGGNSVERDLKRPPVWGPNCKLKTLLEAYDLGPDEVEQLQGKSLPVDREIVDGRPRFDLDFDRLADETA
ncbi:hypothetical protein [Halapricum hydrolyticum]|uniref:Uncharacterized protein n=1 Tax=Halapricum hydrolyticum TaxID=2979991 RepID=A0AAE3LJL9_9EURY|nr:hypothetical protein [Halapricum hydrolyticum]MCU4718508.1 hypothetical protein [Halapricum hydrolyticum]MCU4727473.1 hypothetical protein [Halapricum hydrolyticum]